MYDTILDRLMLCAPQRVRREYAEHCGPAYTVDPNPHSGAFWMPAV